ncbi:hypothetical protein HanRHA438_Chr13g0617001 [Helianthus annuus]|nr:hypothetical protein HanRHA438_Chr13g0617001 [Helianthus annuus]
MYHELNKFSIIYCSLFVFICNTVFSRLAPFRLCNTLYIFLSINGRVIFIYRSFIQLNSHWYTLREPVVATNGFSDENVIGEEDNLRKSLRLKWKILIYEYVNNWKLEQRLHGDVGPITPLTWEIRTNIVNLVDWLKTMVTTGTQPSSGALKRPLLVALRGVDLSAQKRPKMGHVIYMLEAKDFRSDM